MPSLCVRSRSLRLLIFIFLVAYTFILLTFRINLAPTLPSTSNEVQSLPTTWTFYSSLILFLPFLTLVGISHFYMLSHIVASRDVDNSSIIIGKSPSTLPPISSNVFYGLAWASLIGWLGVFGWLILIVMTPQHSMSNVAYPAESHVIDRSQLYGDKTRDEVVSRLQQTVVRQQLFLERGSELLTKLEKRVNDLLKDSQSETDKTTTTTDSAVSREFLLREAANLVDELHRTLYGQLSNAKLSALGDEAMTDKVKSARELLGTIINRLSVYVTGLGRVDGVEKRRIDELERLHQVVWSRLYQLQNPDDCKQSKYLLVALDRPCGFGCNVHHLLYCMQGAVALNRTLLLYSDTRFNTWWQNNMRPLSNKCSLEDAGEYKSLPSHFEESMSADAKTLICPYIGSTNADWKPVAVPDQLASQLVKVHAYPFVWFAGQLLSYLMRFKPDFGALVKNTLSSAQLSPRFNPLTGILGSSYTPVVGVHVRRTDKIGTEANYHELFEYMKHVERYFELVDVERKLMTRRHQWQDDVFQPPNLEWPINPVERRVYLATDEKGLLEEARLAYPNYTFYGSENRAASAQLSHRFSYDSTTDIALDILALANTDYLVCTFSSQVCRVAYEYMQTRHSDLGDASSRFNSLDDIYYYGGGRGSPSEAVDDDPANKIVYGDPINLAGNHWDGYSRASKFNGRSFLMPSFKIRPRMTTAPMGWWGV